MHEPVARRTTTILALALLLITALPAAQAAVTASASSSNNAPMAGSTVTLSYTKSREALDPTQAGSVTPTYAGPEPGSLAAKSYSLATPVLTQTLSWTFTPLYRGTYTIIFQDSPTSGTDLDRQITLNVVAGWTDNAYYTGALSDKHPFHLTDVNADGQSEIIGVESGQIRHYAIGATGMTATPILSTGINDNSLTLMDVNDDGLTDILYGRPNPRAWVALYKNPSDSTSFSTWASQSSPAFQGYGQASLGNLDGGTRDLVMPGDSTNAFFRMTWGRSFPFSTSGLSNSPFVGFESGTSGNTGFALAVDFDGNGLSDILAVRAGSFGVLHNDGGSPPTFSWWGIMGGLGGYYSKADLVDLDQDGLQDVVLHSRYRTITCYNLGGYYYEFACWNYAWGGEPAAIADFNGDGYSDIASFNLNPGDIAIHLNQGGRDAWEDVLVGSTFQCCARGLGATDLDSDGDLDILYQPNGNVRSILLTGLRPPPPTPNIATSSQVFTAAGAPTALDWGSWTGNPGQAVQAANYLKATNSGTGGGYVSVSLGTFTCGCGSFSPNNRVAFLYGTGETPPGSLSSTGYTSSGSAALWVPPGQTLWIRYDLLLPGVVKAGPYTSTVTIG